MEALDLHHVVPHAHLGGSLALDELFDFPAVFSNQRSQWFPCELSVGFALPLDQVDWVEAEELVALLQWDRDRPVSVLLVTIAFPQR